MCYFFDLGQFASTPSEPATERGHSYLCVRNALTPSSSSQLLFLCCPVNHGLDPFLTVTVGPLRGQKNAVGGFRMGKIA